MALLDTTFGARFCAGVLFASLACCSSLRAEHTLTPTPSIAAMNPKEDQLIRKIGLDTLPPGSPRRGVVAVWSDEFASSLVQAAGVEGATLLAETALPNELGEASRKWSWSTPNSPDARVHLQVFVSSAGPEIARRRLVMLTTENQLMDVPYDRGPADLGDASAIFSVLPSFAHVVWAFHNVCIALEVSDAPGVDALAVARAAQRFLARHVVAPLDPAIPRVQRVELSAAAVRVNETLTMRIHLEGAEPQRRFLVALHDRPLDVGVRRAGLDFDVFAQYPGEKTLTLLIADAGTLLSTSAQVRIIINL